MKKGRFIAVVSTLVAVIAIFAGGCSNQKSATSQSASMRPNTVKKAVTVSNRLWFMTDSIKKPNTSHGMEAYDFSAKKVTIYNVNKFYASTAAAKKSGKLSKEGTVNYRVTTNKKHQTVLKLSGKLSGIPFKEKLTLKKVVSGKNGSLSMTGYHVARDLDQDVTQAVFVHAK